MLQTKTIAVVLMAIAAVGVIGTAAFATLVQHVLAAVNNYIITPNPGPGRQPDFCSPNCPNFIHSSNTNSYSDGSIRSNSGAPSSNSNGANNNGPK